VRTASASCGRRCEVFAIRAGLNCAEGVHQETHVCCVLSLRSWGAGYLPGGLAVRADCIKRPMLADVRVRPGRLWWCTVTAAEPVTSWSAAAAAVGVGAVAAAASHEHAYALVRAHREAEWTGCSIGAEAIAARVWCRCDARG
jgi:hypothetical protein